MVLKFHKVKPSYWVSVLFLCLSTFSFALEPISEENRVVLDEVAGADVVYLAEEHANAQDHFAQLRIISRLHQRSPDIAIGLEMFQRPFQDALDDYLAGDISEAELRVQSEYDERWGYDWTLYAPILRLAKIYQIPLIALNTPTEITRKVAFEGLPSLGGEDFRYIPPVPEIKTDNQAYRAAVQEVFAQHGGQGNSEGFENFFAAQVLWDETMAAAVAEFHQKQPQTQIVVLAGEGHVNYSYGIPERVARRISAGSFEQRSVLLGPTSLENDAVLEGESAKRDRAPTDFVWSF